jgi:hypothetical protein
MNNLRRVEVKYFGRILFTEEQRKRFRSGELVKEWFRIYKEIFDEDDFRITLKQNSYHFFEWLAAIVIYNTTGYLSLVEKYRCKNHPRKQKILHKLFSDEIVAKICRGGVQNPDLLCYRQDFKDCFFCEVKGLRDRIRLVQKERFRELEQLTGKEIYLIEFKKKKAYLIRSNR